ncbi:MAG: DUF1232 domain-containing protein [Prevotella sp.]|nr:DUF1232 domain-containing protein [Prevotella sp.]
MSRTRIVNYDVLWDRISTLALKAGRVSTRPILTLWFVLISKETPKADKMLILSTLSYLILPIDILDAKRLPVIGWIDEIGSIGVCISKVRKYITPDIENKVEAILDRWFPEFINYELIED